MFEAHKKTIIYILIGVLGVLGLIAIGLVVVTLNNSRNVNPEASKASTSEPCTINPVKVDGSTKLYLRPLFSDQSEINSVDSRSRVTWSGTCKTEAKYYFVDSYASKESSKPLGSITPPTGSSTCTIQANFTANGIAYQCTATASSSTFSTATSIARTTIGLSSGSTGNTSTLVPTSASTTATSTPTTVIRAPQGSTGATNTVTPTRASTTNSGTNTGNTNNSTNQTNNPNNFVVYTPTPTLSNGQELPQSGILDSTWVTFSMIVATLLLSITLYFRYKRLSFEEQVCRNSPKQ
jgi:hypothetical protein